MIGSFLKSRRSRNCIFIVILTLITILLLFQVVLSLTLYKSKTKITKYLNNTFGYQFSLGEISFNFLRGLHINEASIFYNEQGRPPLIIKDAFVSIKILPILLKRTVVIQTDINEALLSINKERDGLNLQIIFSDIYKKATKFKPLLPNIFKKGMRLSIKRTKLVYAGNSYFEKNMYILLKNSKIKQEQESEKFNFDSVIELNYRLPEDTYLARFFKSKNMQQEIKCSVQGKIKGEDLDMDLILLDIGKDQILGMGVTKDFAERNPYLDIIFVHSTISLENIASIKNNFNVQGNAFLSITFNGPMDDIKIGITGKLQDCNFNYTLPGAESCDIKKFNAEFIYKDNLIKLGNAYLRLNAVPLNIKLSAIISIQPVIELNVSLPEEFLISQRLPLKRLGAVWNGKIEKTLMGDLQINTLYVRGDLNLDMRAHFKKIEFDYSNPKEKYFRADTIELVKGSALKTQRLNLTNFKSKVYLSKNRIDIKEINCSAYNAVLNSEVKLDAADKTTLGFILGGNSLDVKTLMQDINISDKLLSGNMDAKIMFDNQQEDFLQGSCYIKDGVVDLDVLANILKLPSLKNVNFDTIDISFSLSNQIIRVSKIKLFSRDIILDAFWNTDGKIEGVLNLKIASGLLNRSPSFKRLLRLTKMKKPYIDFSFLLGGIPNTARIMWMKGEFKDKIKQELPPWVKRSIENSLDKMIDELSDK